MNNATLSGSVRVYEFKEFRSLVNLLKSAELIDISGLEFASSAVIVAFEMCAMSLMGNKIFGVEVLIDPSCSAQVDIVLAMSAIWDGFSVTDAVKGKITL